MSNQRITVKRESNSSDAVSAPKRLKIRTSEPTNSYVPITNSNDGYDSDDDADFKQALLPKQGFLDFQSGGPDYISRNVIKDQATDMFTSPGRMDFSYLSLKKDHKILPMWVREDGRIILEAFSPYAAQAQDFLITIAEPVSRPARIHEFKLTPYSLYAAVAVGMDTKTILDVLDRFSKVTVPESVIANVKQCTMGYGKVKLVLKHNSYFIESSFPDTLRDLLRDPIISNARINTHTGFDTTSSTGRRNLLPEPTKPTQPSTTDTTEFTTVITLDRDDEQDADDESDFTHSFEIDKAQVESVKKQCIELSQTLMEEYDFRHDEVNPDLEIDLSPKTVIRDYQEKSL
ncbi:hypothetical protein HK097_011103, partial [Rhizophlyctis rosea]